MDSKQSPTAAEVHPENAIVSHGSNPTGTEPDPDGRKQTEPTDLVMTSIGQNLPPPTPAACFPSARTLEQEVAANKEVQLQAQLMKQTCKKLLKL